MVTRLYTDDILVDKVLKGDSKAFETLIKKHQGMVYNYLYKLTLNKEDAEDMTQEVFIKVYNSLYNFEKKSNFSTWVFKIAINTLSSHFRKKKDYDLNKDEVLMNIKCSEKDIPEEALDLKEKRQETLKILEGLTLEQKNAIILKYIKGFSYKEIGEILGVNEDSAKMKVHRAKKKLCNIRKSKVVERGVFSEV
jgi:RNA polymerase sigma-70 factor (ECF subfamily)